jgi:hypothetical protein
MQKPERGNTPRPVQQQLATGLKGRFVGVVGVGKERYQTVLIETVGDVVVLREVLFAGRSDVVQGKPVQGDPLASTLSNVNVSIGKHLRDISDLWQP